MAYASIHEGAVIDSAVTAVNTAGSPLVNNGSNVGGGEALFKQKNSNLFEFRTLTSTGPITVTQNADTITISAPAYPDVVGANVGGGANIYKDKTGDTLNFRTLTAGTGIVLNTTVNTIEVTNTTSFFKEVRYNAVASTTNVNNPPTDIAVSEVFNLPESGDYLVTVWWLASSSPTNSRQNYLLSLSGPSNPSPTSLPQTPASGLNVLTSSIDIQPVSLIGLFTVSSAGNVTLDLKFNTDAGDTNTMEDIIITVEKVN